MLQRLFAARVRLRAAADDPSLCNPNLVRFVADELDATAQQIRALLAGLVDPDQTRDLRGRIATLVASFTEVLGFEPELHVRGALDDLPEAVVEHVIPVIRETLTNVARHAHADGVRVGVHRSAGQLSVTVTDDGVGFNPRPSVGGLGLGNLRCRARFAGGYFQAGPDPSGGTRVVWAVPTPAARP